MKASTWIIFGAAALGVWWWYRRTSANLPLIPWVTGPYDGFSATLVAPPSPYTAPAQYLPPVAPAANGGGWDSKVIDAYGAVSEKVFGDLCAKSGGGSTCKTLLPVAGWAGKGMAAITVKPIAVVASAGKKVLKKVIPGW